MKKQGVINRLKSQKISKNDMIMILGKLENDFDYNGKIIGINDEMILITVNSQKIKIKFDDCKTFFKSNLDVEFYKKKYEKDIK